MKFSINTVTLLLFAGLLSSCNDDFLERIPLDELSLETFFQNENDLRTYNNGMYDQTRDDRNLVVLHGHHTRFPSSNSSYWYLDGFTDNTAPVQGIFDNIRAGVHRTNGRYFFGWGEWGFLRTINIGLANYDRASIDQKIINNYTGEARLFRAWFYWDRVSKFGDIPYIDKELSPESPELFGERDDRDFVMTKVLEDLEFAEANLPDKWPGGDNPGRMDKAVALALKARICLFEGTWQKYRGNDGNMWLEKAAAAAKELMDSGEFELNMNGDSLTAYNEAFAETETLENNPEIIYWIKYEATIRDNNIVNFFPGRSGGATKEMVEDYLCSDGLPINLSPLYAGDTTIESVFINRDPRLPASILNPKDKERYGYNESDASSFPRLPGMGGLTSSTGYHIVKGYSEETDLRGYNRGTTPAIAFRLGETYLIYAEAMAELGQISQDDLDMTINKLRDRVGMPSLMMDPPMDPRYADVGISSLLVEIRRERRVELFIEGQRYDDIRRWKCGKELTQEDLGIRFDEKAKARYDGARVQTIDVDGVPYVSPYKGTSYENPTFDEDKHYLWPIPNGALSSNPNLGQNPNWE
ncbi:RagB/SusD family nutrient uptake outer membrane protein [Neolewinella antarctica]|uniref:RagB/SusD domain-containing protein n=1 Tax=Neolewinella antarctica TaxID=442734 RepID=A0ABX0XAL4_9BACT|nr:RagB/SusD family nutrient uptake outer membrane protein [Neolewinella antarctica]NJC26311.1 hypothetical protein [Neolewinella antarctica]